MSDDLTVFGTDFTDVTGLKVKLTDNGYVKYVREGSRGGGNATQDAQGRLVLSEGDGTIYGKSDPIRFFDYDGTLVASYLSVPSSLPAVPTHEGLTNGTWNYTLQEIATQFNAMGTCDVGANYETTSGATEIDIELLDGRLHPYLSLAVNGTVSIDWGDGSTPSTSTGSSLTSRKSDIHHEYTTAGNYTIKISLTGGTGYALYCSSSYPLLNMNSGINFGSRVYSDYVKTVRIGNGCTIGSYAFAYCSMLESVSIPSGATISDNYTFTYCYKLPSVSIPSGVTTIRANMFTNCYSLESIELPSSVTSISDSAFSSCYSLESITIPSTVTSIGSAAFSTCRGLKSVSIPSGVTSIKSSTFGSCYSLKSIPLPSSVTSIGDSAFSNCHLLKSIELPSNITSIGDSAFSYCSSLKSVSIPSGVTSINGSLFYYCYSLESVTIPNDVTNIGKQAFCYCSTLRTVEIPSSVTSIGYGAFNTCVSLTSIELPSNLTTISANKGTNTGGCFAYCYSLTSLTIPAGVTEITSNDFATCYGIAEYHFLATTPPTLTNTNAFTNIPSDCVIYVPAASLTAYQTAENWSTYADYMVGE